MLKGYLAHLKALDKKCLPSLDRYQMQHRWTRVSAWGLFEVSLTAHSDMSRKVQKRLQLQGAQQHASHVEEIDST